MKLFDVFTQRNSLPKRGDFEFVVGSDGLGHLLVAMDDDGSFFCPCTTFPANTDPMQLEVAKVLSCMSCQAAK